MGKRHPVDKLIRWGLKNWYKLGWALFGCAILYMAHQASERFMAFTGYLFDKIEAHDALHPAPAPPEKPNTQG